MYVLFIFTSLLCAVTSRQAQFMETLYLTNTTILTLEESGEESLIQLFYSEHVVPQFKNCSLTISAASGYYVIVTIQQLLLSPFCKQNLRFVTSRTSSYFCASLQQQGLSSVESNSLVFRDDSVTLIVSAASSSSSDLAPSFDIVFTAAKSVPCDDDTYQCNNDLCVWDQLRCDDVNNCGDNSDEVGGRNLTDCRQITTFFTYKVYMYVGLFVLCIILACGLCMATCYCSTKTLDLRRLQARRKRERERMKFEKKGKKHVKIRSSH